MSNLMCTNAALCIGGYSKKTVNFDTCMGISIVFGWRRVGCSPSASRSSGKTHLTLQMSSPDPVSSAARPAWTTTNAST